MRFSVHVVATKSQLFNQPSPVQMFNPEKNQKHRFVEADQVLQYSNFVILRQVTLRTFAVQLSQLDLSHFFFIEFVPKTSKAIFFREM